VVRHPNGHLTNPAAWYKSTDFSRLPALVFFDEKGRKVLETDALVKHQRMMNAINYVLERAYKKDWTYQRFSRNKAIERNINSSMK
jgi:thioredoxin-related protein